MNKLVESLDWVKGQIANAWALTAAVAVVVLFGLIALMWRSSARPGHPVPCLSWLSWLLELDNPIFRNNRAATIVGNLEVQPGMTALDAGCGPGRVTVPLATSLGPSGRVIAIDTQEEMLRKAAAKAQRARATNIEFRRQSLGEGHAIEGQFDRAVLVTVLGEIPNPQTALKEIFACLVPGGILAITEVIADPHFQRLPKVREFIKEAGFRERKLLGSSISYTLYVEKPATRQ